MELFWLRCGGCFSGFIGLHIEFNLTCVNAHSLHLPDELLWHLVSDGDVDHLGLALLENALGVLKLSDGATRGMVT